MFLKQISGYVIDEMTYPVLIWNFFKKLTIFLLTYASEASILVHGLNVKGLLINGLRQKKRGQRTVRRLYEQ